MQPFLAGFGGFLRLGQGFGQAAHLGQHLGAGHAVVGIVGIELDRPAGRGHRLLALLHRRQHPGVQPVGAGVVRLQRQRLLQVAAAEIAAALQHGLGTEHKRLGRDRLQNELGHLHRGFVGLLARLERKQHAALGIGQAEDFAQLVGNQHRPNRSQVELLGDRVGRKDPIKTDDHRGDLVVRIIDLHAMERLDGVQFDQSAVLMGDFLGLAPGFCDVFLRRHARE